MVELIVNNNISSECSRGAYRMSLIFLFSLLRISFLTFPSLNMYTYSKFSHTHTCHNVSYITDFPRFPRGIGTSETLNSVLGWGVVIHFVPSLPG